MHTKPFEVYVLCILLLLLAVGAIYGGGALIISPDGSLLQMQPWLGKIPFNSFLIPGIILFVFNGLFPLLTVFGLLFKPEWQIMNKMNLYSDKNWSWSFSLYCGIITVFWIIAQQFMTDYFILQPIVALTGLLIIIFTMMPRVIRYYTITN